jgi:RecB family exonuclease
MELHFDRALETTKNFVELDRQSREEGYTILPEESVSCPLGEEMDFILTARLDRIELLSHSLRIVDYKTGTAPPKSAVVDGRRLQLPVEALILSRVQAGCHIDSLRYWLLKQRSGRVLDINDGEKIRNGAGPISIGELIRKTEEFLRQLLGLFDRETQSYPATSRNSAQSDFSHLSRLEEWLYGEDCPTVTDDVGHTQ